MRPAAVYIQLCCHMKRPACISAQLWHPDRYHIQQLLLKIIKCVLRSCVLLGLSLSVGDSSVAAVSTVRNLGAHLFTHMEMTVNTSNVVKPCYFQLDHIARIGRYLPRKTTERVVNAPVTSRLDYCNSLMHACMVPHNTLLAN